MVQQQRQISRLSFKSLSVSANVELPRLLWFLLYVCCILSMTNLLQRKSRYHKNQTAVSPKVVTVANRSNVLWRKKQTFLLEKKEFPIVDDQPLNPIHQLILFRLLLNDHLQLTQFIYQENPFFELNRPCPMNDHMSGGLFRWIKQTILH